MAVNQSDIWNVIIQLTICQRFITFNAMSLTLYSFRTIDHIAVIFAKWRQRKLNKAHKNWSICTLKVKSDL
ncbi:hypothetical protein FGO68_gene5252 [Halteria grandinella]|uniref:Uncharacterized protein n=1 Tax=Halteria grandinella TaxID=5974 RepID=A0A8J8NQ56_HALGN|nr:hypothetical protein FGO68_gene5252 [Halteria grandinella]